MRLLSKLLTFAVFVAHVSIPAAAQNEDCLTVLDSCQICVQRNGMIDIRACGEGPPTSDSGIPVELLEDPQTDALEGLQKLIAERILSHWDVLYSVFGDPNRIYLPREAFDLAGKYPGATADEILRAAVVRFQSSLIAKSSRAQVMRFPTGDGGERFVIRSTDSLLSYVIRLLTDAGAFVNVDLNEVKVTAKRGQAPEIIPPAEIELFRLFRRSLRLNFVGLVE